MIGHLHYIMSSKYELFFYLLSVALVIINHHYKKAVSNPSHYLSVLYHIFIFFFHKIVLFFEKNINKKLFFRKAFILIYSIYTVLSVI